MEEFLHWFQGKMPTPTWFGWFHLLWIGILIAECVLIWIFRKRISPKMTNMIVLFTGIALILFETYKQIEYSFNYNGGNGNSTWSYQWYAFPFQFCSTPMYLMIAGGGFLRKGKIHDCIMSYLATFALFAGLIVMISPGDVFTKTIGINIQTMFWHSSMVSIGFLILATKHVELNFKTLFKSSCVFIVMVALALFMNIAWHFGGINQKFNMFYISPYYPCHLIVLDVIYANLPYVVFLLIYIIGFTLAAGIILMFAILVEKLIKKSQTRKMSSDEIATEKIIEIIKND